MIVRILILLLVGLSLARGVFWQSISRKTAF